MQKKQRIAVIGTNGLPARYGGFETLADHLTRLLSDRFSFVVYCSRTPKDKRLHTFNGASLKYLPFRANGYQSIIYDISSIIHAWFTSDALLVLGTSGALVFPFKRLAGKKLVVNLGGMEWARGKWSLAVRLFLRFSEWLCVKCADVVVTDNAELQALVHTYYGVDSALIEYGGDHARALAPTEEHLLKYPFLREPYALSVSRAQSDNNLHMVLEAFERTPGHHLVLVSNWHTSEYGRKLKAEYAGKHPHIHVVDAIYDQSELDVIRSNARLYIHSHSFCGTAPSLVEAMSLGLPTICFNTATNLETTENRSHYFGDAAELERLVSRMTEAGLQRLGDDMSEIARRRYTWKRIAESYARHLE